MKAVVAAFNQERALVGAFSVITNLRMELFEALQNTNICVSQELLTSIQNEPRSCFATLAFGCLVEKHSGEASRKAAAIEVNEQM